STSSICRAATSTLPWRSTAVCSSADAEVRRAAGGRVRDGQLDAAGAAGRRLRGSSFSRRAIPIALHVDDVEAARSSLEAHGIAFKDETMDSGVCHMAFFDDPDGNALVLHHRHARRTG